MIVEFSVKNYRSIRELQTLSFVVTGLKSPEPYANVDTQNVGVDGGQKLLKTVGIYGANGSGKSNVVRALHSFMEAIALEPSPESKLNPLYEPFYYQEKATESESYFQITLILSGKKYRYGLAAKEEMISGPTESKKTVVISKEWLYGPKKENVVQLFERNGKEVVKDSLTNSEKIPALPYEHTLFLTHAAAFDSEGLCALIRSYFRSWTISNLSFGLERFRRNTLFVLEKGKSGEEQLLSLLSSFGLNYNRIWVDRDPKKPNEIVSHSKVFFSKAFETEKAHFDVVLNLEYNESSGTQKLFDLAGLLLRAFTLPLSAFIILDEIDSHFHPSLLLKLIQLFNNPDVNKSNSQLLFTSHDTNLMSPEIMRRDQFYFTEKTVESWTRLYALSDLRGIRNDADFAKQYLAGFYGATPVLESYSVDAAKDDRPLEP